MFGPNVTLCTGTHLVSPKLRKTSAQYNKVTHIGNNVWLGASVTVLPGVRIGDNSKIGAGSVVTKDIPENVIAFGIILAKFIEKLLKTMKRFTIKIN